MRRITVILLCLVVVVGYSCKSTKSLQTTQKAMDLEDQERFEALLANVPKFNTFSSKINLSVTLHGNDISARGTLKMIRDEALQLSVQLLGLEMFRLYMTPDSVVLIDRINSRYLAEKTDKYLSRLPLELHLGMLQSLFLNQPFLPDKKQLGPDDGKRFSYKNSGTSLLMEAEENSRVSYGFYLNEDNLIARTQVESLPRPSALSLKWDYSLFEQDAAGWFPKRSQALLCDDSGETVLELQLTYSKPQWNDSRLTITAPVVSSKYKRIDTDALIKSLLK